MFIVIDMFSEPIIMVDPETGLVKHFDSHAKAQTEANKCQEAIVVPLDGFAEGLKLLSDANELIHMMKIVEFEGGEEVDRDDLEGKINDFLAEYNPGSLTQEGIENVLRK